MFIFPFTIMSLVFIFSSTTLSLVYGGESFQGKGVSLSHDASQQHAAAWQILLSIGFQFRWKLCHQHSAGKQIQFQFNESVAASFPPWVSTGSKLRKAPTPSSFHHLLFCWSVLPDQAGNSFILFERSNVPKVEYWGRQNIAWTRGNHWDLKLKSRKHRIGSHEQNTL